MDKHPLQSLIEDGINRGDIHDCKVRSYSGRAMYGKECLGVDIDCGGLGSLMSGIVESIAQLVNEHADDDNVDAVMDEISEIARGMKSLRSDQMGLGTIFYFTDVPFVDDEDEEDEDGEAEDD